MFFCQIIWWLGSSFSCVLQIVPMVVIIGGVVVFVSSTCVYFAAKKMDVQWVLHIFHNGLHQPLYNLLSVNHFAGGVSHTQIGVLRRRNLIMAAFDPRHLLLSRLGDKA
jgi:hypothetical protein